MELSLRRYHWLLLGTICLVLGIGSSRPQSGSNTECINIGGFVFEEKVPVNQYGELSSCQEHANRTCCSPLHASTLSKKFQSLGSRNYNISKKCLAYTQKIFCSLCDADIGQKRREGICEDVCNDWFSVCYEEYYTNTGLNQLNFCSEQSLICWNLNISQQNNPKDFCRHMGFNMNPDQSFCYDLVPSAKSRGSIKKSARNTKASRTSRTTKSKSWSLLDYFIWAKEGLIYLALLLFFLAIAVTIYFTIVNVFAKIKHPQPELRGANINTARINKLSSSQKKGKKKKKKRK